MTNKLKFGMRPFEFGDFLGLIDQNSVDVEKSDYASIVEKHSDTFKHFEITADLIYVIPGLVTEQTIGKLLKLKEEKGITFSVHLPLWSIEPSSPISHIREASIKTMVEIIHLFRPLDPVCYVIHATGALISEFQGFRLPDEAKVMMNSQFATIAYEALKAILQYADIPSRKLAVENVEFPFTFMEKAIEELDLGICFDTGHLLAGYSGREPVMEFMEKYYDRIVELHLHDGRYPRIDHRALGNFDLPAIELLTYLSEKGFTGPLVFEQSLKETMESLEYIKANIPEILG